MTCPEARTRLAAYVSGDLSAGDSAAVEAHLSGCASCRSEVAAFAQCEEALSVLAAVEQAPDLSEDLRRRIAGPIPGRPRWGLAAAVASAAVAVTAMAVLLSGPPKAPAPSTPIVRQDVTPPAVVSVPEAAVETAASMPLAPAVVSTPRPVPAEAAARRGTAPAVVSVPVHVAEPADLEQAAAPAPVPVMASLTTQPKPAGGVVLLLAQPEPPRRASSCYLEVSLPNGARSVLERTAEPEAAGRPRVVQISYEQIAPQPEAQDRGG